MTPPLALPDEALGFAEKPDPAADEGGDPCGRPAHLSIDQDEVGAHPVGNPAAIVQPNRTRWEREWKVRRLHQSLPAALH
jgi:hypothetical protein